jgi:putative oxidoreductase
MTVKIVAMVARYLLGLVFLVFGLNKFFNFIPSGPLPAGVAGEFVNALITTKYIMFVGLFEAVGGLLLLINRYVPLALCLLAPVIVNILLTGVLLVHQALGSGIVVAILWILVFMRVKGAFAGIFEPLPQR